MDRCASSTAWMPWIAPAILLLGGSAWCQESRTPPTEAGDAYYHAAQSPSVSPLKPIILPAQTNDPALQPLLPQAKSNKLDAIVHSADAPQHAVTEEVAPFQSAPAASSPGPEFNPESKRNISNLFNRPIPKVTSEKQTAALHSAERIASPDSSTAPGGDVNGIVNGIAPAVPSQSNSPARETPNETLVGGELVSEAEVNISHELFEPGRVLAIVGGRPILVGDMLYEINELIERHAAKAPEAAKQAQRKQLVDRMLPKFIDRQLVYVDTVRGLPEGADIEQINESLGKSFDEEAMPQYLEQSQLSSPLQFDAHLRALGSSLRQFRQSWIDDQVVKYFLSKKMEEDDEVSYQEMFDYYSQHAAEFQYPAKARWEQLVVLFSQVPDRQAARRMISEMGNEVVYGAALDAVARKSSHDIKAKDGGQQGWISQGSLASAELDQAIFETPLNTLSDIIETPRGFHIIRVLERAPAGAKPFRDAQVEIKESLSRAKREKRFEDYMNKLRREIPIELIDGSVQLPEKYNAR